MGTALVMLMAGALVLDQRLAPWYPLLLLLVLALAGMASAELLELLPVGFRPPAWLCYAGVFAIITCNWLPWVLPAAGALDADPWHWIGGAFVAVVLAAFISQMAAFREPGDSIARIAHGVWLVAYLGLLPSFFVQLRWLDTGGASAMTGPIDPGTLALALAAFVPKCGDIGAYFTGRWLGRHPMAPVLSPKKTWEGAAGGVMASIGAAVGINRLGPVLHHGLLGEIGFGLSVGIAGILGDLAESLIKRDSRRKDASQTVPGFGGILDMIDSVVFAAPAAYCWIESQK